MDIKASKLHIVRSATALVLVGVITLASVFSVAAAVQSGDDTDDSSTTNGNFVTDSECELSSGDLMITRNNNFNLSVDVIKANVITVVVNGEEINVLLAKGTVEDALNRAGVVLTDTQVVTPSLNTEITSDTTVVVEEGIKATVTADGETNTVYLHSGNVVDALNNRGYAVGDDDILSVGRSENVSEDMSIEINRVKYVDETETQSIAFEVKKEGSGDLALGETQVKTEGVDGTQLVTSRCKYVDGVKVSEKVIDTEVTEEPVDKVILIGAKGSNLKNVAGTFVDSNGQTVAYSRVITGSGTAYTAPPGAGTATGVPAYHGGVAVNPNIIPYGSKLYIVSTDGSFVYGYATAVDTGGALMDGSAIVDCFYDTYNECVNFGRRNVNVYIVG